jgi:NarL family two-component system response regulator LiaR
VAKIKVLIADDHAVVREGTRRILQQEQGIEVVAEAGDGEEAIRLATSYKPDVVIMDIAMPRLDGIEATRQIKKLCPDTAVLILSAYDDDQFVFSLLEAGAAGYLLKSVRGRELTDAVLAVHAGESVLHPSEVLSDREMQVLKLAARGMSNQDIAEELCLSTRTVQGHLGNIFNKLSVSSRTEAVIRALKEGWITLDDVP